MSGRSCTEPPEARLVEAQESAGRSLRVRCQRKGASCLRPRPVRGVVRITPVHFRNELSTFTDEGATQPLGGSRGEVIVARRITRAEKEALERQPGGLRTRRCTRYHHQGGAVWRPRHGDKLTRSQSEGRP